MIKFKCRCSRGSLSEHINEIIAKYECPESCSRPIIPSLPAPRSKTTVCPSLLPLTCSSSSSLSLSSTTNNNKPHGIRCLEPSSMKLLSNPTSSRLQAFSTRHRFEPSSSSPQPPPTTTTTKTTTTTTIQAPPFLPFIPPGPNLKRYLASKSLKNNRL